MYNILFVFHVPFITQNGGVERVTDLLTKALIANGHTVYYLSSKKYDSNFKYPTNQYYFPSSNYTSTENIDFYNTFLEEKKINIIINQNGAENASYLYLKVKQRNHLKIISVIHINPYIGYKHYQYSIIPLWIDISPKNILIFSAKYMLYPFRLIFYKINKKIQLIKQYNYINNNSDIILLLSKMYFKDLLSICPKSVNKLKSIPNPIELISNQNFEKKKQILYVGRFDTVQKRLDRLLKIWRKIYQQNPEWELILVGYGDLEKYLHAYIKRHQIERVVFAGKCDPTQYYQTASILCLTSNYEGLPMVILEAMQYKVIPIAFNSFASITDLIIPDKTGIIVTPFDLNEYAQKLEKLMLDSFERKKIAIQAYQHVCNFSIKNIVEQWENLFKQLVNNEKNKIITK